MNIQPTASVTPQLGGLTPLENGGPAAPSRSGSPGEVMDSFQDFLTDSLGEVNDLQQQADALSVLALRGELPDISQAMVAVEKAQLALELTTQVRDKFVEAYREVMRMPI